MCLCFMFYTSFLNVYTTANNLHVILLTVTMAIDLLTRDPLEADLDAAIDYVLGTENIYMYILTCPHKRGENDLN
jgi:hypothetical protein